MSIIIEAPNEDYTFSNKNNIKIFLAGGITNCSWWQNEMIKLLKNVDNLTIYNPRRKNFPIDDPTAAEKQITWEFVHLTDSDMIMFWFDKGSLNPIVLLELGKYALASQKKVFIGIDKGYEREQDVLIQTKLSRPDVDIVYSLEDLSNQIKTYIKNLK